MEKRVSTFSTFRRFHDELSEVAMSCQKLRRKYLTVEATTSRFPENFRSLHKASGISSSGCHLETDRPLSSDRDEGSNRARIFPLVAPIKALWVCSVLIVSLNRRKGARSAPEGTFFFLLLTVIIPCCSSATNTVTGEKVALKKIRGAFGMCTPACNP